MRIGVVSDSHGDLYMLDKAIQQMGDIECLIHLGDHSRDVQKVNQKWNKVIYSVAGNNDFSSAGNSERTISLGGKRIFITHGHKYSVHYEVMNLYFRALEEQADIVLYGHTHIYYVDYEGSMFFLNPGSVSRPRAGVPSAAVLIITPDGDVYAEKVTLG